jgi:hypothetical protein
VSEEVVFNFVDELLHTKRMKKIAYLIIFNLISILNYSQTIESQIDSILSKAYAKNEPEVVTPVQTQKISLSWQSQKTFL